MSNDVAASRSLHDLLEDVRIAMVMTSENGVWTSRPLTCVEVDHSFLRFLVDGTAQWIIELEQSNAALHVTFADARENTYVSVNGAGFVSADPAEVERLWSAGAAVFFTGPDDPNVRVLQIEVTDGSWWDGPTGRLGQAIGLLRAAINDDPSMAGDHGSVDTRS